MIAEMRSQGRRYRFSYADAGTQNICIYTAQLVQVFQQLYTLETFYCQQNERSSIYQHCYLGMHRTVSNYMCMYLIKCESVCEDLNELHVFFNT